LGAGAFNAHIKERSSWPTVRVHQAFTCRVNALRSSPPSES
jgi:hypothetical protein